MGWGTSSYNRWRPLFRHWSRPLQSIRLFAALRTRPLICPFCPHLSYSLPSPHPQETRLSHTDVSNCIDPSAHRTGWRRPPQRYDSVVRLHHPGWEEETLRERRTIPTFLYFDFLVKIAINAIALFIHHLLSSTFIFSFIFVNGCYCFNYDIIFKLIY